MEGIPKPKKEEEEVNMGRRGFLKGLGAAAAVGGIAGTAIGQGIVGKVKSDKAAKEERGKRGIRDMEEELILRRKYQEYLDREGK